MTLRVKHYRELADMTQTELAEAIGKTSRSVQQWEAEECYPNSAAVLDMCEVLHCSPNDLLGWGAGTGRDGPADAPRKKLAAPQPTSELLRVMSAIDVLRENGLL